MGVFIGWWRTKFVIFRNFSDFFGYITVKTASFSVQTVEFIFKQLNFNSNGYRPPGLAASGSTGPGGSASGAGTRKISHFSPL
jgi:hypothetical protein